MNSDNYMNHLAPNDRSGTQLKSSDQRAAEARVRIKDECRSHAGAGACMPMSTMDWEARSKDYRAMEVVDKRKLRGGANFNAGDAF